MAICPGQRLQEDTASYPHHGRALVLPPLQLRSPPGLTAFGIAPFAAHLGGNAGGLLLLSVSIFRAWRGFWQRRRPAHAAPSSASLAEGLAALPGCGFRGLSLPCRVPVHLPAELVPPGWAEQQDRAGRRRCRPARGSSQVVSIFCGAHNAVGGFHGGRGVLCGHGAGWHVA